jgi:hypothetical protein
MKTYSIIRDALAGQRKTIQIGRSRHTAGFGTTTPIDIVAGANPPKLKGLPYLKTGFSNGRGFHKTLYTPSTLVVEVGAEWLAEQQGVWR